MKKLLTTLSFILLATTSHAQSFQKRQTEINVGVGILPNIDDTRFNTKYLLPPLIASVEYGLSKHISLGVYGNVSKDRLIRKPHGAVTTSDTAYHTYLSAGLRSLYHLRISRRFDFYAGGMLGMTWSGSYEVFELQILAGAKYRIDDRFGVYLESYLAVLKGGAGLSYRFLSERDK